MYFWWEIRIRGTEEFRTQLKIAGNVGLFHSAVAGRGEGRMRPSSLDAVFGVGLSRPVEGITGGVSEMLASKSIRSTVAVDVPSGIHGDTGIVHGHSPEGRTRPVTFGWEKPGQPVSGPGVRGPVEVADIGFPGQALEAVKEAEGRRQGILPLPTVMMI